MYFIFQNTVLRRVRRSSRLWPIPERNGNRVVGPGSKTEPWLPPSPRTEARGLPMYSSWHKKEKAEHFFGEPCCVWGGKACGWCEILTGVEKETECISSVLQWPDDKSCWWRLHVSLGFRLRQKLQWVSFVATESFLPKASFSGGRGRTHNHIHA